MQVGIIKKPFILSTLMVEVGVSSEQFYSSHTISCFLMPFASTCYFQNIQQIPVRHPTNICVFISIIAKLGPRSAMTTWSFAAHVYSIHTRIKILLSITHPHVIYNMFPFK